MPSSYFQDISEIRRHYPIINRIGCVEFGQDYEIFGDTICEIIEEIPPSFGIDKRQELRKEIESVLKMNDDEMESFSKKTIGIDPRHGIDPLERGYYDEEDLKLNTYRKFWLKMYQCLLDFDAKN